MDHLISKTGIEMDVPGVRHVATRAPLRWLALGWQDLRTAPLASLSYGLVFVLLGYLVIWASWESPTQVMSFVGGFLLVAPFLAIAFYALSRQIEKGQRPSLRDALLSWRGNGLAIALFALMLGLLLIAWIRFATLLTALSYYAAQPTFTELLQQLLMTAEGLPFLGLYLLIGGVLAVLVYMGSVVALPLMIDRPVDPVTAVISSGRTVLGNLPAMLLWAALIAALTLAGMAFFLIGLAITWPWIGHASWHAYRELVAE